MIKKDKHDIKHTEQNTNTENDETVSGNNEEKDIQNNVKDLEEELNKSQNKLEQIEKELQDYKDRLLRKAAEFENFKRRTENDQLNLIKYSAESFIIKILPIVDDFERSLLHLENAKDIDAIKQGVQLVYDKLIKILNDQGVTKIDALGKPFDVQFHEAMMQRKEKDAAPHTVLDEIEKGYLYKDRVIRHAKVIVSEDTTEEPEIHEEEPKNNANREEE